MRSSSLLLALGIVTCASPATVAAEGAPRRLRLAEAVTLALQHNPSLAAAASDISLAAAAIEGARGLDDPTVAAQGGGARARAALAPGATVQQTALDGVTGTLALTKPLPSGGQLGVRVDGGYSRTRTVTALDPSAPVTALPPIDGYAADVQLTFAHPLLRGAGVGVARADRRRARARMDLVEAQRADVAAALLRDVVDAYWDLAYATQEVDVRRASAAAARDQLRRVEANIAVGKQPRSASAEIDVAIALRDEGTLLAEEALADRAGELGRLCGMPAPSFGAPAFVAADVPAVPGRAIDGAAILAAALDHNAQLQAARAQGRAASIEVDVTENGLLPQLDVSVAAGPTAAALDPGGAYGQLTGFHSYTATVGLTLQAPLGNHAARGARDGARESLRKARLSEADIAQQITAAVARAADAAGTARRRVEVLARSIQTATLDLEAERARFEAGRSTTFDVLRRQDALATVELAHARARVDLLKALAALDALTGDILAGR